MKGGHAKGLRRRDVLLAGVGASVGLAGVSLASVVGGLEVRVTQTPANAPLRRGDLLVFAEGDRMGTPIAPADVPAGEPPLLAWPMDPASKVVRKDNQKNAVQLVRAAAAGWYAEGTAARTAGEVAAYAAVCTHLCCVVSDWKPEAFAGDAHGYLLCPCHRSHFDPWDGGRVLAGPAPRPLPALPLALDGGVLTVAGDFTGPVGCSGA